MINYKINRQFTHYEFIIGVRPQIRVSGAATRYIHEAEDLICQLQKTNLTIYFSLISSQSKKYIYLVFCYPRCHTFPTFIIKCLLKFYFGPQYYTSCIMAYSHEKHSKEVQVDLFRKFKICYAQRKKHHIYISLICFNQSKNIYTRCLVLSAVWFNFHYYTM